MMTKANYRVTAEDSQTSEIREFKGVLDVPDWYFEDEDSIVIGEPDSSDDVLMLLLHKLQLTKPEVLYWNIQPSESD